MSKYKYCEVCMKEISKSQWARHLKTMNHIEIRSRVLWTERKKDPEPVKDRKTDQESPKG